MPYIVIILIVFCLFPLIPLAWYGIKEDYERKSYHYALAVAATIVLMVLYAKAILFIVGLANTLLF